MSTPQIHTTRFGRIRRVVTGALQDAAYAVALCLCVAVIVMLLPIGRG